MKLALFLALACASSLAASPIDFHTLGNRAVIQGFGSTEIAAAAQERFPGLPSDPRISASVQADEFGYTLGPRRPGFLILSGGGGGEYGGGWGGVLPDHRFACGDFGCTSLVHGTLVVPVTLGTEFTVEVAAFASNALGFGGSGYAGFTFSLRDLLDLPPGYDPNNFPEAGMAEIIYQGHIPVPAEHMPEPSTWVTLALGLGVLLLRKFRFTAPPA